MNDTARERLELKAQEAFDEADYRDFEHRGRTIVDALLSMPEELSEVLGMGPAGVTETITATLNKHFFMLAHRYEAWRCGCGEVGMPGGRSHEAHQAEMILGRVRT